jgi:hypothetical protein
MTPERMRVKLAEWAGYSPCPCKIDGCTYGIPDYPSDLDAVRELERRLGGDQMFLYYQEIYWLVESIRSAGPEYPAQHYLLHTSAPQRCEALLKTLGLWEDA